MVDVYHNSDMRFNYNGRHECHMKYMLRYLHLQFKIRDYSKER